MKEYYDANREPHVLRDWRVERRFARNKKILGVIAIALGVDYVGLAGYNSKRLNNALREPAREFFLAAKTKPYTVENCEMNYNRALDPFLEERDKITAKYRGCYTGRWDVWEGRDKKGDKVPKVTINSSLTCNPNPCMNFDEFRGDEIGRIIAQIDQEKGINNAVDKYFQREKSRGK